MKQKFSLVGVVVAILLSGWMIQTSHAAITIPNIFSPFTTIQSSQLNANFAALGSSALNVNGDTMLGDLKFTDGLYDIGNSGAFRPRDLFISRNETVGGTLSLTGNQTNTTGSTLTVGANTLITSDLLNALKLSGVVPPANLGSGSATSATFLRGDSTYASIPTAPCYGVVVGKTASYGAALCDLVEITSGTSITITLPAASTGTAAANHIGLKNDVAAVVTVARTGSDTIDGVAGSFSTFGVQYESFDFVVNAAGTGWMVR